MSLIQKRRTRSPFPLPLDISVLVDGGDWNLIPSFPGLDVFPLPGNPSTTVSHSVLCSLFLIETLFHLQVQRRILHLIYIWIQTPASL